MSKLARVTSGRTRLVVPLTLILLGDVYVARSADSGFTVSPNTVLVGGRYTVTIQATPCGSHDLTKATVLPAGRGVTFSAPSFPSTCTWNGTVAVDQEAGLGEFDIAVQEGATRVLVPITVASPFTIYPQSFVPGKSYTVVIQVSPCADHDLTKATIAATGAGIAFTTPTSHMCDWTGTLTVSQDAETGNFQIIVREASSTWLIPITVAAKAAGPIPPGLQPTVDLAWEVLPRRTASDNFGARISKLYYPIEVVIGNNSGYDLQIAAVQFKLPNSDLKNNVPSDSYYIVRSSLQREQLIGARNTTVNIIKAIGPILTGSAVFFSGSTLAAMHHKNIFQGITDIFSNPFEKGIELIVPDQTVQQLINLDNHTLRDGMIIPNNTQVRSIVFVNRDLLQRSVGGDKAALEKLGNTGKFGRNGYDQQTVMRKLGSLELVGRPIAYLNRVSVISNAPGPAPTFTLSPTSITQGDSPITLTLTGDGLAAGMLTASDPSLVITNPKAGDGGKSFTATVDGSKTAPGTYTFTLTTSSGSQSQQLVVKPHNITITPPTTAISVKAGDPSKTFGLTGMYLKNATGVPTSNCSGVLMALHSTTDDTALQIDITALGTAPAVTCTASIAGTSGVPATFPFAVTH